MRDGPEAERDEPKIGGTEPITIDVVAGETYWWCMCGRSQNQPFCDGSHEGTGFEPMAYKDARSRPISFCTCKRTRTPPFCDDSHDEL
jgi:CDGSH-type Zn-finger protein